MNLEGENELIEEVTAVGDLRIQIWRDDLQHALDGHPEVTIERVKVALKDPFKVVKSETSNRVCLFYAFECRDEISGENIYFCAVVAVMREELGKIETAYETTYVKTGEVLFERRIENARKI